MATNQAGQVAPDSSVASVATIVQQGKLLDFIDGRTQRDETPEEYVRQQIARSLVREYGYARAQVSVEFGLRLGTRRPRADLIVFGEGDSHAQDRAYIIVECKSPKVRAGDRKEGVGQLHSYMAACPNAHFGMWINGVDRQCFRRIDRDGTITFEEILDLPVNGASEEETDRPRFDQLRPAASDALLFAFSRCHNYIAGNQGLQKPDAFWELLKLIFCKIHDERESRDVQFWAGAAERQGMNGQLKVKQRVDALFEAVKGLYPTIFKPNEQIDLDPRVLSYLVSQLQSYALLQSDVDVKGRAYEAIVGSNLRGDRGEFFTPRNICEMAVAMLDPDEQQLMLDPACGTGGFLITAMNHVIGKIRSEVERKYHGKAAVGTIIGQRIASFASGRIVGIDLNPSLVKASKMNMVMNNDGAGGLYQANTLASPATWDDQLRDRRLIESVDLIFTNPPFGSKIQIDDPAILEQYELARSWQYDEETDHWIMNAGSQRQQPPEILFIERCVQLLKPGTGRAAIVVPDGILGSPGLGYVREWIFRNTRLLASIDLHPDTFQPDVSVQTSLIVLQRKSAEEMRLEQAARRMSDYQVFMAVADHVGHDKRGNKTYVRDRHGNEVVEEVQEPVFERRDGAVVAGTQAVRRKVLDDNTLQIAKAFRAWLSESS